MWNLLLQIKFWLQCHANMITAADAEEISVQTFCVSIFKYSLSLSFNWLWYAISCVWSTNPASYWIRKHPNIN